MDCVGGKVLYEFFTSDMVGFLVSTHVDCIVLRQEYLGSQYRFRSKTYISP